MSEVIIGPDASTFDDAAESELLRTSAPHALADVELHLRKLRAAVDPATVRAADVDIEEVEALCAQVEIWAAAEGHFPEQGSVLAECGFLDIALPMLMHERSPVVMASLGCLQKALQHPLQRRIAKATKCRAIVMPTGGGEPTSVELGPLQLLYNCMRRFPNKEELQVLGISVAPLLAKIDVEEFLVADVISATLAAMKAHRANDAIQKQGVALFAALIDCQRDDPRDVPIPILFVSVGAIVEFLFSALKAHPTNTDVIAAVAHCIAVMSAYRENRDELIATDIINVCVRIMHISKFSPSALTEALTTLSNMSAEMDTLQKKSIVLETRTLMTKVADPRTLAGCCALLLVIMRSFEPLPPQPREQPDPRHRHVDAASPDSQLLVNASASAPASSAPPVLLPPTGEEIARYERECELEIEMKRFMSESVVPFICLALEHYGDIDPMLQRAGEDALRSMVIRKWR